MKSFVSDLIGAIHIDVHDDVKKAWRSMVKRGLRADELTLFTKPPVTEKDMWPMIDKWDDGIYRNQTINSWIQDAKARYAKLLVKHSWLPAQSYGMGEDHFKTLIPQIPLESR